MFALLLENPNRREPGDLQSEARNRFSAYVSQSHLDERRPSSPIPQGTYVLIGVASYSPLDLELLDEVDARFADWGNHLRIAAFDLAVCQTNCDVNQYLPTVGSVAQSPVVSVWQDGRLVESCQGLHDVRKLLKAYSVIG